MYFRVFHDQVSGHTSYLLGDLANSEAILIDPKIDDVAVTAAILNDQRLRLKSILFTHEHEAANEPNERVLIAYSYLYNIAGTLFLPENSDVIKFGNEYLQLLNTPGHTLNCKSFLWRDRLFCGDVLTVDACPHQPRPVSPSDLWNSATKKIFMLPAEIFLFSGHAKRAQFLSTVLQQRLWHPWFSGATRDAFFARIAAPTNAVEQRNK
ncbi:hypothetical protein ACO0K2_10580 [Undibacterium sp. MH2W]|uniref:hypothetical protein n=1 Tax=Undibacterium sp. MH2W TaxID=3413044 RepID=UPI003BF32277